MFKVMYQKKDMTKEYVHQTSWGFSTRSIGAFVAIHSDNKGLVLTPRCADKQIYIVPIYSKGNKEAIDNKLDEICAELREARIRFEVDDRNNYSPGFRFNCGEIRGMCSFILHNSQLVWIFIVCFKLNLLIFRFLSFY